MSIAKINANLLGTNNITQAFLAFSFGVCYSLNNVYVSLKILSLGTVSNGKISASNVTIRKVSHHQKVSILVPDHKLDCFDLKGTFSFG